MRRSTAATQSQSPAVVKSNMFLKRLSHGSKECIEELKLECKVFWARQASFGHLGLISDPLIISKFPNETNDPKGQENKIYTIVKGSETFYRCHTVPITSCSMLLIFFAFHTTLQHNYLYYEHFCALSVVELLLGGVQHVVILYM